MEGRFSRAVPLVIFGGLGVLAGLSAIILPETWNRNLPDTVKESVNLVEWVKFDFSFYCHVRFGQNICDMFR